MLGGIAFLAGLIYLHVNGMPADHLRHDRAFRRRNRAIRAAGHAGPVAVACRAHQGRADAVPHLAVGCHGCPHAHERPAALVHHGQSRRVPDGQAEPALCHLSRDRLYGHECGCHHVFARCPSWPSRRATPNACSRTPPSPTWALSALPGRRRAPSRVGRDLPDPVPHGGQVAAVSCA